LTPTHLLEGRKTKNTRDFGEFRNFKPASGKRGKPSFYKMKEFFLKKKPESKFWLFFIFFKKHFESQPYLNPMLRKFVSAFPDVLWEGESSVRRN